MNPLPTIGITCGDPAGIGPEIVLAAAADPAVRQACRPVLIGDVDHLRRTARLTGLGSPIEDLTEAGPNAIAVKDVPSVPSNLPFGADSAEGGEAAYKSLVAGVGMAEGGEVESLVTAPISKRALHMAGRGHLGHTELLAEMTGSPWSLTYFTVKNLRVLFLTRHLALREALDSIDGDLILRTVERFCSVSHMVGLDSPRLALQAMNPHGGEGGLFGTEEIDILAPATAKARDLGFDLHGPIPADSVFALAMQGCYDVVVSLYHDMAAGICKSIDFHGTVSTTLGLPFLRFSVDHGTAFDLAGKGTADPANMVATVLRAAGYSSSSAGHRSAAVPAADVR
ncbi:4-hydroxythreonine-4-phosphate dehydrogenase PdxA [Sinomonas notoginsengisoli]|uniref:PdxA family dehydrogenase n=1 Tax=Sinomonas notoginsengisoli TaxID=1457311 RepID=UPI001F33B459|nr:4-hydroxythreonine-4-phosphate dehydrogenase PdxA [Sinomonas notoginsengisoli]